MNRMTRPLTTNGDTDSKFPLFLYEPHSRPPKLPPNNLTGAAKMCSERKSEKSVGKQEKIRRELIKNGKGELKMILVIEKGLQITTRRKKRKTDKQVPAGGKCEDVEGKIGNKYDTPAGISPPRCQSKSKKKRKFKENIPEKQIKLIVNFFEAQMKTDTISNGGKPTTLLEGASQLQQGTPSLNPYKPFCLRTQPRSQSGSPEHLNTRLADLKNHKSSPDWPSDSRNGKKQPMRETDTTARTR